jgi:hypothetical protein
MRVCKFLSHPLTTLDVCTSSVASGIYLYIYLAPSKPLLKFEILQGGLEPLYIHRIVPCTVKGSLLEALYIIRRHMVLTSPTFLAHDCSSH